MQEDQACSKRFYRKDYIPWLDASYDTHIGKRWLNSNLPKATQEKATYHIIQWSNKIPYAWPWYFILNLILYLFSSDHLRTVTQIRNFYK